MILNLFSLIIFDPVAAPIFKIIATFTLTETYKWKINHLLGYCSEIDIRDMAEYESFNWGTLMQIGCVILFYFLIAYSVFFQFGKKIPNP